jgi:hypothetical protein
MELFLSGLNGFKSTSNLKWWTAHWQEGFQHHWGININISVVNKFHKIKQYCVCLVPVSTHFIFDDLLFGFYTKFVQQT